VVGLRGYVGGFCGVESRGVEFVDEVFEMCDLLAELVKLTGIVVVEIDVVARISGVGIGMGRWMHVDGIGVRGSEGEGGGEKEVDGEGDGE